MKWELSKFEDVALPNKGAIVSGPFGSNIGSRFFVEEGIPVIRGNNLTFGKRRSMEFATSRPDVSGANTRRILILSSVRARTPA